MPILRKNSESSIASGVSSLSDTATQLTTMSTRIEEIEASFTKLLNDQARQQEEQAVTLTNTISDTLQKFLQQSNKSPGGTQTGTTGQS